MQVWVYGKAATAAQIIRDTYLGIDALLIGDWVIINLGRLRATYAVEGMARKKKNAGRYMKRF
jgi:hypothetical protein